MAHPPHATAVTFPGSVRFASQPAKLPEGAEWLEPKDPKGRPLVTTKQHNDKGEFTGTTVIVPPGFRLAYAEAPPTLASFGGSRALPTYVLTMHKDEPVEVVHAELEHETKSVTVVLRPATHPDGELTHTYDEPTGVVTARSTKHEGIEAVGGSAAEAIAKLRAAVAAHVGMTEGADADAKKKKEAADDAADVAEQLHKSKPPPKRLEGGEDELPRHDGDVVTRHG